MAATANELQGKARALGDPTRYGIYQFIATRDQPVDVWQLVDEFDLNHTTIRQHLARLREAGLIREEAARPTGPGRPRLRYRLTDEAATNWNREGPYERLSLMLLGMVGNRRSPYSVGVELGRRSTAPDAPEGTDPVALLQRMIADQGFAPHLDPATEGDGEEIVLDRCPFEVAAIANPQVVCELHRGLAAGMAEAIDGITVDDIARRPPREAGCRVKLTRKPTTAGPNRPSR